MRSPISTTYVKYEEVNIYADEPMSPLKGMLLKEKMEREQIKRQTDVNVSQLDTPELI